MNVYEHAAQIWSLLGLAAHNRQVLTYTMVGRLTGLPARGLGRNLEPIQSYCLLNGLPPLTILVVSQDSGMPGVGFVAAQDIPRTQQEVFAHDWLAATAPTPEVLEDAVRRQPSNGVRAEAVS